MTIKPVPTRAPAAKPQALSLVSFRFLRLPEVRKLTGLSRSQIYRLEAAGRFPKRVKLGDSARAWIDHEVAQWQADRIAASREVI